MNSQGGKKRNEIVNTSHKKSRWVYIEEIGKKGLFATVRTIMFEDNEEFQLFLVAGSGTPPVFPGDFPDLSPTNVFDMLMKRPLTGLV